MDRESFVTLFQASLLHLRKPSVLLQGLFSSLYNDPGWPRHAHDHFPLDAILSRPL